MTKVLPRLKDLGRPLTVNLPLCFILNMRLKCVCTPSLGKVHAASGQNLQQHFAAIVEGSNDAIVAKDLNSIALS
ncbi:hypothetical protein [Paracoccus aerius]|uniref:Uncharacterized protein n=1 Tax=Paracoccus aerius TaxID=1915382 RepID=A0ABS1SAF7_9RHOB|nr:hypothetical protein [Paracoccus aerius]MBL3675723.1 hypothetical protein [Paracoccus aerius]